MFDVLKNARLNHFDDAEPASLLRDYVEGNRRSAQARVVTACEN